MVDSSENMKTHIKCITGILLLLSFFPQAIVFAEEFTPEPGGEKRIFRVSAYYSPVAGQSRYVRGSFEADKKLNGNGTNGADGTEVYPGMLAAPKTYPFGTKIHLPGLGVGTVHDRGGAIVPAGARGTSHDRLDVWMGSGDIGLARALAWGMRTVEGIIYWAGGAEEEFTFASVAPADLSGLPRFAAAAKRIEKGASGVTVVELQKKLAELGFYKNAITGNYDDNTSQAMLEFQLQNKVIGNRETSGAGTYGPRTQDVLAKVVAETAQQKLAAVNHLTSGLTSGLALHDTGAAVSELQKTLRQLGVYSGDTSGTFGPVTAAAVKKFQLAQGIIQNETDDGAGVFGPTTLASLKHLFAERQQVLTAAQPKIILTQEFSGEAKTLETPAPPQKPEVSAAPGEHTAILAKEFPAPREAPETAVAAAYSDSASMAMEFAAKP